MSKYNVVMETSNSTVVAEYEPLKRKSDSYQSEAALEQEFIRMLQKEKCLNFRRKNHADKKSVPRKIIF